MAGKNTAVFGIYRNYAEVERGVDALQAAGFRNTDISVLFPETSDQVTHSPTANDLSIISQGYKIH